MPTRDFREMYPALPFDLAGSELFDELKAYCEAINSYPDSFAKNRVSFQTHLLSIICPVGGESQAGSSDNFKPSS
jgi:hypothetical protein